MSAVVSCTCGAKLRLPEAFSGRALRCPKCSAEVAVARRPVSIRASALAEPRGPGATCPICQSTIGPIEAFLACPACDQVHHRECWIDVGGCATYGCENAPASEKPAPAAAPRSAWGENKRCPACGETIKAIALKCRFCETEFDTVDPLSLKDLRKQVRREENLRSTRGAVVALFILSIIGCFAPFLAVGATIFAIFQRPAIKKAGPAYVFMVYSALGISYLYSMLIVVFVLFSLGG